VELPVTLRSILLSETLSAEFWHPVPGGQSRQDSIEVTWFWPGETRIAALIAELSVPPHSSLDRWYFLKRHSLTAMGTVSPDDRRRMNRQAAALRDLEISEDGDEEQRAAAIDEANADRRRHGLDELKTEGEFHRKAIERGVVSR